ncbi:MAG: hypothetical protein KAR47_01875 [Planctomycetes bacterium]|nr:hypothetical protein [Planctomycetota bacterium]
MQKYQPGKDIYRTESYRIDPGIMRSGYLKGKCRQMEDVTGLSIRESIA